MATATPTSDNEDQLEHARLSRQISTALVIGSSATLWIAAIVSYIQYESIVTLGLSIAAVSCGILKLMKTHWKGIFLIGSGLFFLMSRVLIPSGANSAYVVNGAIYDRGFMLVAPNATVKRIPTKISHDSESQGISAHTKEGVEVLVWVRIHYQVISSLEALVDLHQRWETPLDMGEQLYPLAVASLRQYLSGLSANELSIVNHLHHLPSREIDFKETKWRVELRLRAWQVASKKQ